MRATTVRKMGLAMYFREEHQTLGLRFATDAGSVLVRVPAGEPFPRDACPLPEKVYGLQVAVLRDDRRVDWFCTAMDGALWRYLVNRDAAGMDVRAERALDKWALAVRMGQEAAFAARAINHRENATRAMHRALATEEVQRALQSAAEQTLADDENGRVGFLCLRQGISDSTWHAGVQYLQPAGEASWRWVGADGWVVPIRRKHLQFSVWQADSTWPATHWPVRAAQELRLLAERAIDLLVDSHSAPHTPGLPFRGIASQLTEAVNTFAGAVEGGEQTARWPLDHALASSRVELTRFVADGRVGQDTVAARVARQVLQIMPLSEEYDFDDYTLGDYARSFFTCMYHARDGMPVTDTDGARLRVALYGDAGIALVDRTSELVSQYDSAEIASLLRQLDEGLWASGVVNPVVGLVGVGLVEDRLMARDEYGPTR